VVSAYFPKSTSLTIHTAGDLATVAAELNARPRKTLNWVTPADRLAMLLATHKLTDCCDDR